MRHSQHLCVPNADTVPLRARVVQVCVTFVPTPSFILLLQLSTSAIAVWALSGMGVVSTERMEMAKAKKYMLVVACFAGFLYCNVKALQVRPHPGFSIPSFPYARSFNRIRRRIRPSSVWQVLDGGSNLVFLVAHRAWAFYIIRASCCYPDTIANNMHLTTLVHSRSGGSEGQVAGLSSDFVSVSADWV